MYILVSFKMLFHYANKTIPLCKQNDLKALAVQDKMRNENDMEKMSYCMILLFFLKDSAEDTSKMDCAYSGVIPSLLIALYILTDAS